MFERKSVNRTRVVVSDFALRGVEAHALADDGGLGTGVAPDGEGELEANGEEAGLGGTDAEGVAFAGGLVGVQDAFVFGRDVASHIEALHFLERGARGARGGRVGLVRCVALVREFVRISCGMGRRCARWRVVRVVGGLVTLAMVQKEKSLFWLSVRGMRQGYPCNVVQPCLLSLVVEARISLASLQML